MKTIHIYQHAPNYLVKIYDYMSTIVVNEPFKDCSNNKRLIKKLYNEILINDGKFHFLFQPEMIIRISDPQCLDKVKSVLENDGIKYIEYDYPAPKKATVIIDKKLLKCYGEKDKDVPKKLNILIDLFHVNSVAAIVFEQVEQADYMEKNIHSFYNQACLSTITERKLRELVSHKNTTTDSTISNLFK